MSVLGSTDLSYYRILPTIFCIRFIHSGPDSFESSVLIGYCAAVPYLFGAEGYGALLGTPIQDSQREIHLRESRIRFTL